MSEAADLSDFNKFLRRKTGFSEDLSDSGILEGEGSESEEGGMAETYGKDVIDAKLQALRQEFRADLNEQVGLLRTDIATQVGTVRTEMATRFGEINAKMEGISTKLTIFGTIIGILLTAIVGALVKLLFDP